MAENQRATKNPTKGLIIRCAVIMSQRLPSPSGALQSVYQLPAGRSGPQPPRTAVTYLLYAVVESTAWRSIVVGW